MIADVVVHNNYVAKAIYARICTHLKQQIALLFLQVALKADLGETFEDGSLTANLQLACDCTTVVALSISINSLLAYPTLHPTPQPSPMPSPLPSPLPTLMPSPLPTLLPTSLPTPLPTALPSPVPTPLPSSVPTSTPTLSPTRLRCLPGTFTEEEDFDCNFGDGICGFVNTGSSDWVEGNSLNSGSGGSIAGPSEDRTTGSGTYVYAPAVSHSAANQTFVLEASLGSSTGSLSFYYHLIGCGNSMLTLFTEGASGTWTQKWSIAGTDISSADTWQIVELDLASTEISLRFVAYTPAGASQSCAAALDDVYVKKLCTPCPTGQYQTIIAATSCLPCINGSYCETEGLSAVTDFCAAGQYSG